MSTMPEPMTVERLVEIEALAAKTRHTTYFHVPVELVKGACQDVPALVSEVRRLKDKYEGKTPKCNGGHDNVLPLALWDCPTCTEALRSRIQSLEAAHAGLDLMYVEAQARRERAERERDQAVDGSRMALAHVVELRGVMLKISGARTEGGCSTGEAMSKTEAWARQAIRCSPAEAVELQAARRAVVKAAKGWVYAPVGKDALDAAIVMKDAVEYLEQLEAQR